MAITIADVAARAGVSKTTVSRVLNGKGELDVETASRVRQVIDEMGYVPSARAVGLARGRTRVVGMLVPSMTWPWIGHVLQGAIDLLEGEGYGLMLFTCNRREESLRAFASRASARSFDGLLAIEPEGALDTLVDLQTGGMPVVLIDDRISVSDFPCVVTDNREGARLVAEHLLGIGRVKPLVISGVGWFGCTSQRLKGFTETYAAAGHPLDPRAIVEGDFTFDRGVSIVERALSEGLSFDAVFAHNDLSAGGAIRALHTAGLAVPNDVAVVGFDDIEYAGQTDPPLTTIRQPMQELGGEAARLLVEHFGGNPLPRRIHTLGATLVVRGSTVFS